jgi:hypothetical protein
VVRTVLVVFGVWVLASIGLGVLWARANRLRGQRTEARLLRLVPASEALQPSEPLAG